MESSITTQLSRRLLHHPRLPLPPHLHLLRRNSPSTPLHHRHASSTTKPSKPIVLEPPDKFRPPSHPQRLNTRRTTTPLMTSGGGYNQSATAAELETQRTKRYPHMFPQEGTVMFRFLTNKMIHVWITLGVLCTLAVFTLTTTFLKTSPFAHLLPSISSLPFHPINYIREYMSVVRLHIDYTTEQTAQKRQKAIQDAQKRRIYRRAHGMENMDRDEDMGVDVRGIVSWDDGLTDRERARGGRREGPVSGRQLEERAAERRRRGEVAGLEEVVHEDGVAVEGQGGDERPRGRRVKRWFGIWE